MTTNINLINRAISAAKSGDRDVAERLLEEIERRMDADPQAPGNASVRKVVEFVRRTYDVHRPVQPSEVSAAPAPSGADVSADGGVSVVTCCMNRTENLLKALPTWLALPEIGEVVIVDWSSRDPVDVSLREAGIADPRIRIVRAVDEPRWILSYAFNLGFRHARHERILKVDADITLKPTFFSSNILKHGTFIAGNWEVAEKGQEHINGFFYLFREDLLNIRGFNEYITTYGWDDDDIYSRLGNYGLKRICVDTSSIYHIPHDDAQRLGHAGDETIHAVDELHTDPLFKIRGNRYLAMVMPPWKIDRQFAPFDILRDEGSYIEVRRKKNEMPHYVGDDIKQDAEYYAALELVSWRVGMQAYHLSRAGFYRLLESKRLGEITTADIDALVAAEATAKNAAPASGGPAAPQISSPRRKLFIDTQHGLGNRLRAMASAAVIADATDREVVVVWQPDHHCDGRIFDLFDYPGAVIETTFVDAARSKGMSVFNYMEVEDGADKDGPVVLDPTRDAYARSAYVLNNPHTSWDLENRWLQNLTPTASVLDLVNRVRQPNDLSAHVRMEAGAGLDHNTYDSQENWTEEGHRLLHEWRAKSHFSHFMKRIDALIEQGAARHIFLAADRPETYEEFLGRYGDRVAFLSRDVYDRSATQLRYALADAILLSSAPRMLGSTWSSFSELAMRLSKSKMTVEMSGRDF